MRWRSDGLKSWVLQRVSAVYMGLFLLYFIYTLLIYPPQGYQQWLQWVAGFEVNTAIVLFFLALLIHVWIGLRDVIMDYVHPLGTRFVLLTLLIGGLIVLAVWLLRILQNVVVI